jgi:hypothetical protein
MRTYRVPLLLSIAAALILSPATSAQTPRQPNPAIGRMYSGAEEILAAEFEVQRWQQRVSDLRNRALQLKAEIDQIQKQGQFQPGQRDENRYLEVRDQLERITRELSNQEPMLQEAVLKLEQARQVQALRTGPLLNIAFGGGTIQQYIEGVKKAAEGVPVNILLANEIKDWQIGPITLERVSVAAALHAIPAAAPQRGQPWQIEEIGRGQEGAPVFRVSALTFGPEIAPGLTKVHSLASLVVQPGGYPPEAVLAAVEAALSVGAGQAPQMEMKFHRDTKLLLVNGAKRELAIVEEVLGELLRNFERQRGQERAHREELLERQAAVRRAEIDVRTARAQMQLAQQRFDALRQMEKTGAVSADEILKMQSAVNAATADVERAEVAFELARGKLEMLVNPQPPTPPAAPPAVGGPSGRTPPPPGR